jgi:hypothetical protein
MKQLKTGTVSLVEIKSAVKSSDKFSEYARRDSNLRPPV